jgi:rhamnopyranosyl-N-acetylglucosaminyl-diphospho-decaprenol beta-1,3/1,4-galactofuranosyltransferase
LDHCEGMEVGFEMSQLTSTNWSGSPPSADPARTLRIAAVFATMDRVATAEACVRALASQTRPPDLVVVADNVSSDGTAAKLEEMAGLPFPLVLHRMAENRGNAGGVQEAMDFAFTEGADAVWILDDDSWPRPGALAALLEEPWDPAVMRHSLQIDPGNGRLTWPMWVLDEFRQFRLVYAAEELPPQRTFRTRIAWTGALLPRKIRERVGPVLGELFIRGEDEEYPLRVENAGFRQEAVAGSVLDHPGPVALERWGFFGKHLFIEPCRLKAPLQSPQHGVAQAKPAWQGFCPDDRSRLHDRNRLHGWDPSRTIGDPRVF